ncbi:hypothetical protein FOXYSP1_08388 [Fusarium oxysporum f. sp. phaseoli]
MSALQRGHSGIVQLLIDSGAKIDAQAGALGTALQSASYCGQLDFVQILLDHHADVNLLSGTFGTALQAACYQGHEDIVQLLVDYGADVNAVSGSDETALQIAAICGQEEVIEVLLRCDDIDLDARGGRHGTALGAALHTNRQSIVKSLIEHGAQMDVDSLSR